jgi:Abnormal spindle-like microcephaly-assoc'd, ASPM-SPD-2-Hydin
MRKFFGPFFVLMLVVTAPAMRAQHGRSYRTGTNQVRISSLNCASTSISGAATDNCTVTLNAAAPSTGQVVTVASSNSTVLVPASITVPAGATSAGFSAKVSAVSTSQTATIAASSGGATQSVALQLNAIASAAKLTVNATSIAFGTVTVNTTNTQSVTLSSTGSAAVTINGISVTGSSFSVSGVTAPLTLNPGQSVTLSVLFKPATSGSLTGQLAIASNSSSGGTTSISLAGTGQSSAFQVNLSWSAPSSSPDPVASYKVFRASSGGTSYQQVGSSTVTQTNFVDSAVTSGQSYNYMVESVDSSGITSVPSNTSTVAIP